MKKVSDAFGMAFTAWKDTEYFFPCQSAGDECFLSLCVPVGPWLNKYKMVIFL